MAKLFGGINLNVMTDLTKVPQKVASAMSVLEDSEMTGAEYKALMYVGDSLVRGTNYHFIAEQTLVLREPIKHVVKIAVNEYKGRYEIVKGSIEVVY